MKSAAADETDLISLFITKTLCFKGFFYFLKNF